LLHSFAVTTKCFAKIFFTSLGPGFHDLKYELEWSPSELSITTLALDKSFSYLTSNGEAAFRGLDPRYMSVIGAANPGPDSRANATIFPR
jgi:hypothetical protein